jgi:tetratricopeptide (TPR) repeat protein
VPVESGEHLVTEVGPDFDMELIATARQILGPEVQEKGWNYDLSRVRLLARGSVWADLDGDGMPELYFAAGIPEYGGPAMCGIVRRREDEQVGVRPLIACEQGLRELAVRDINGDGTPELVLRWQAEFGLMLTLYILRFDGTAATSLFPNVVFHQGFMETKDLDGDGQDELVVWAGLYETNPRWGPQRFGVNVFRYNGQQYELQFQHETDRRYLPAEVLQQRIAVSGLPERFEEPPTIEEYRRRLHELIKNNQVDEGFVVEMGVLSSQLYSEAFYAEALKMNDLLQEAVGHLQDAEERRQYSFQTWESRGRVCLWIGLWQEAIDSYLMALDLAVNGVPSGIDPVYGPDLQRELGFVYSRIGDYSSALTRFSNAEELIADLDAEADDIRGALSRLRSNRALVYAEMGDYGNAETSFREAIDLDQELGRTQQLALNYTGLGNVQRDRENYPDALRAYDTALSVLKELSERDRESDIYLERGLTLLLQDQAEQALPLLQKSLLMTSVPNISHHAAAHYLYLGEAHRASGGREAAADFFTTAAELAEEYSTPETRWQALHKLALIADEDGRPEQCKELLERCIGTIESLRAQYLPESLKIALLARKAEPYESMALFLLSSARRSGSEEESKRDLREAFAYVEQAKSRVFVEQLATTEIKPTGIARELLDQEAGLLRRVRAFRSLRTAEATEQRYLWGQEISETEEELRELWHRIGQESGRGTEYVELRQGVPRNHSSVRAMLRNI